MKDIIQEPNSSIDVEYRDIDYGSCSKISSLYQKVQRLWQSVEKDLLENLITIGLWQNREKVRQAKKPRWTFYDESRYRNIISKAKCLKRSPHTRTKAYVLRYLELHRLTLGNPPENKQLS